MCRLLRLPSPRVTASAPTRCVCAVHMFDAHVLGAWISHPLRLFSSVSIAHPYARLMGYMYNMYCDKDMSLRIALSLRRTGRDPNEAAHHAAAASL